MPPKDQTPITRRETARAAGAVVAAATGVTVAGSASAHHQGQTLEDTEGFFNGSEVVDGDRLDVAIGTGFGLARRAQLRFSELDDAESIGADLQAHINDYSADYIAYVNDRDLGNEDREVLLMTIRQEEDEVDLYLVGEYDADADEYTTLELLTEDSFEQEHGDRDADEKAVLEGPAASEAPDDLDRLHTEFIEPNEDVDAGFASEMAATYAGDHVSSTLLGDDL